MSIRDAYESRSEALESLAERVGGHLKRHLADCIGIDRIYARPKSVDSFVEKSGRMVDGMNKYSEPLQEIQDQIGARVITRFLSEAKSVSDEVEKYYQPIEHMNREPESEWAFGYFGMHYVLFIPTECVDPSSNELPRFFELQIKTLHQHAWSEANHGIGYKPGSVPALQEWARPLALASAQAWGADRIFEELFQKQRAAKMNDNVSPQLENRKIHPEE